jgi:hypothetical protein
MTANLNNISSQVDRKTLEEIGGTVGWIVLSQPPEARLDLRPFHRLKNLLLSTARLSAEAATKATWNQHITGIPDWKGWL